MNDVKDAKYLSEIGFRRLASAIVKQAAKDRAKEFFFSDRFDIFMPQYNGPAIWKQIEENYKQSKKWCSKDYKEKNDSLDT
jgi:hypothetical protein